MVLIRLQKPELDKALQNLCFCEFAGASNPESLDANLSSYGLERSALEWAPRRLYNLYHTGDLALKLTTTEEAFLRYWVADYHETR